MKYRNGMNKYSFLIKPVFYIANLAFATWLVFAIEGVRPSDLGRYGNFFNPHLSPALKKPDKKILLKLCKEYKLGIIDSLTLERNIDQLLLPATQPPEKQ